MALLHPYSPTFLPLRSWLIT